MIVSNAIEKMIDFYQGSQHDINHFLKVWSYARNIGLMEGLDDHTQEVLELTAVAHHHTYTGVDGIDYQILLETVFQTESGIRLLKSIYLR